MSDFVYTPAQEKAVYLKNKNIIISAAAGSGKTKVLVDRVIRLVKDEKVPIDKMIIVTFTNKAAIEMKGKISKALEDQIKDGKSDKFYLRSQIKALKNAHIQTLHAFCADLLRENFYLLKNLSPSFKVASDNKTSLLKKDALEEIFDYNYEYMTEDFETFLHNFASFREDSGARVVIEKTFNFINSQVDPLSWLEEKSSQKFDNKIFISYILEKLETMEKSSFDLSNFCKENNMRDKFYEVIYSDFEFFEKLVKRLEKSSLDEFLSEAKADFVRFPGTSKSDDFDLKEYVKSEREIYKEDFKELYRIFLNTDSKTMAVFNPIEEKVLKEIARLTKDFYYLYQEKKNEKSYLDFNDMEHRFIELLNNNDAVEKIKEQFSFIFFDEYQDSNEIQNYIIEKLKGENNLFFVGDVKQSIYGFRLARADLFLEKLDSYKKDENSERIDLNENFRTDEDVIYFNNYIFDRLMTKESSLIDYKNGGHRLNATVKAEKSDSAKVEVISLAKNVESSIYITSLIEELLDQGFDYKDIVILFRSSTNAYKYEQALKKAGIPFFSDISKLSFDAVEVTFFINFLKYIDNPKDDITLLSVLRSSIFDFTEEDLSKIRLSKKSKYFYEAFESYEENDEIYEKKLNFETNFIDFSYQLSLMNLYDFGNYVFEKSNYYEFLLARDRGEERVKNVESLIDFMADYDSNNDNGFYGFLSYIEGLKLRKNDTLQASRDLSENENLVRLMTIHKSKGLEFPVVIMAECDKSFNMENSRSSILFDNELGIGINVADYKNRLKLSSITRDLILEKSKIADKREEMRVLYVALTRAINRMYIVGRGDYSEKKLQKLEEQTDYLRLNSYMDWILSILLKDKITKDYKNSPAETDAFNDKILALRMIEENADEKVLEKEDIESFLQKPNFDKKILKEFENNFNKAYQFLEDTKNPIKKSVTEIAKNFKKEEDGYQKSDYESEDIELDFKKPDFLTEERVFRPTDKGTIIHKVFQNLELKEYDEKTLDESLKKIVKENKLSNDEIKLIDKEKIISFFNNDLIKNIKEKSIEVRREESFLMEYDDSYLNGQIDMVFESKDSLVLIDFKTDRKKRDGFYDMQIAFYKKALEEALGKSVIKSYIYWYNFMEFSEIK